MSYKQGLEIEPTIHSRTPLIKHDTNKTLRKNFSKQLNICIKRYYSGKKPSYAVIARDYSLRVSGDGAVSAETIRKWMLGIAVPQSSRLSTLIQWLGFELAEVLNIASELSPRRHSFSSSIHANIKGAIVAQTAEYLENDHQEKKISSLIKKMSKQEKNMLLSMLEALKQARIENNE